MNTYEEGFYSVVHRHIVLSVCICKVLSHNLFIVIMYSILLFTLDLFASIELYALYTAPYICSHSYVDVDDYAYY